MLAGAAGPMGVLVSSSHHLWKTPLKLGKLYSLYPLIKSTPALGSSQSWGEGGYLQCKGDKQGAPGSLPSWHFSWGCSSQTESLGVLGSCQQREIASRLPGSPKFGTSCLNCCSSGFSVLPASKVCQLLWHLLSWLCIFTAVQCL